MNEKTEINLDAIRHAATIIGDKIVKTELIESAALSAKAGTRVFLKPECLQNTGSFKIRGAANKIASLKDDEKNRGIVTASSGNHGRAVAYVAEKQGVNAVVCMSPTVPKNKVDAIRGYGAEVVLDGAGYDDAERVAFRLQKERGLTFISAFDDPYIIAGQGTVGIEILDDMPQVDTVVVPLSGGGLISGVASAVKQIDSSIRVIGVSMDRAPMMYLSLKVGEPVEVPEEDTLADALVGSIGVENRYTFQMVRDLVDDVVLVSEEEILTAMRFAVSKHDLLVEGGGAVGLAAVMHDRLPKLGRNVAIVISGGNVDPLILRSPVG